MIGETNAHHATTVSHAVTLDQILLNILSSAASHMVYQSWTSFCLLSTA